MSRTKNIYSVSDVLAYASIGILALLAGTGLISWYLGSTTWLTFAPHSPAFCWGLLMLCGGMAGTLRGRRRMTQAAALAAASLGSIGLLRIFTGIDAGIEYLFTIGIDQGLLSHQQILSHWEAPGLLFAGLGLAFAPRGRLHPLDFHLVTTASFATITTGVSGALLRPETNDCSLPYGLGLVVIGAGLGHLARSRFKSAAATGSDATLLLGLKALPGLLSLFLLVQTKAPIPRIPDAVINGTLQEVDALAIKLDGDTNARFRNTIEPDQQSGVFLIDDVADRGWSVVRAAKGLQATDLVKIQQALPVYREAWDRLPASEQVKGLLQPTDTAPMAFVQIDHWLLCKLIPGYSLGDNPRGRHVADWLRNILAGLLLAWGIGLLVPGVPGTVDRRLGSRTSMQQLDTGTYRTNERRKSSSGSKLISTEHEFRTAIMEAPFPVMIHNSHGEVLLVNRRWTQLSGYSEEEIPSLNTWMDLAYRLDDETDPMLSGIHVLERVADDQNYTIHTKGGDTRHWLMNSRILSGQEGHSTKVISMAVDVTENYHTQRELDQFFNLSIEMLCIISMDGYLKRVNPSFVETFGYTKEDLLRHRLLDLVHEEDKTDTDRLLRRLADGEPTLNFENRILSDDGNFRWLVWSAFPDVEDHLIYAAARDITDEKLAHQEILRTAAQLEKSNRELETFANVASHDLREPLRTIASFTELLESGYGMQLDEEARRYMQFISSGAKRSQALIKALLDYSRVGTKGDPFEFCDCNELVAEVLDALNVAITESRATINAGDLPTVRADPIQLAQVFQNLLKNAIKFRRADVDPVISIVAIEREEEWQFSIQDNGIGIEKKYFDRIFTLFQRLHGDHFEGTGLGLSICKRVIDRHHGRIWVESKPGEGTAFHFTIPKQIPADGFDSAPIGSTWPS